MVPERAVLIIPHCVLFLLALIRHETQWPAAISPATHTIKFHPEEGRMCPPNVGKTFDTKVESASTMNHRQNFVSESVLSVWCVIPVTWTAPSFHNATSLSVPQRRTVRWMTKWISKGCGRKWSQHAVDRMRLELGTYKISDELLICEIKSRFHAKIQCKFVPVPRHHIMKAYWGFGGTASCILYTSARVGCGWVTPLEKKSHL
jgi:hypothetical protein